MNTTKNKARVRIIQKTNQINHNQKLSKSRKISNFVITYLTQTVFNKIGVYLCMKSEVNLDNLILKLMNNHKFRLFTPATTASGIKYYPLNKMDDLKIGKLNVREPESQNKEVNKSDIQVILIPGLAFDKYGNRLGRGLGFFDRFLKDYQGVKIGICFSDQIVEKVPTGLNDIKMDMIISEKGTIKIT